MKEAELNQLVDSILALGQEREWIEFKKNKYTPELVGQYVSGLSNSARLKGQQRGYLIFGVEDKTLKVVGTRVRLLEEKHGNEPLEAWLNRLLDPHVHFEIYDFTHSEVSVSIVIVDAAPHGPVSFRGVEYVRVGSTLKKLRDNRELERKLWGMAQDTKFENRIAANDLTEQQVIQLVDYPKIFELIESPLPTNRTAIIAQLGRLGVLVDDGSSFSITNAGALLFARRIADFPRFQRKAVRLIVYDGRSKVKTKQEIEGQKGYAVGFEGLINSIERFIESEEEITGALRKVLRPYPRIAIRELVANALIHQDLLQSGTNPMVEIFEDRMEITNNGKPLIDPLQFLNGAPISRNETIARLMRECHICEERGSGIDKVVHSVEEFRLPPPNFITLATHTRAVLYAPRPVGEMSKQERVRACYQHACLKYESGDEVTNSSIRERFGIADTNYPAATKIINEAIREGYIKPSDPESKSKRHASYIPIWASNQESFM